eukprot:4694001-Pyramimonas_sp.AAC.1
MLMISIWPALMTQLTSASRASRSLGKCKLNKHTYTNCVARHAKDGGGNVTSDQDEHIKQLRPIQHPELTVADADAKASNMVADMFFSLRGA